LTPNARANAVQPTPDPMQIPLLYLRTPFHQEETVAQ
jgi:hypothetical protein